MSTLEVWPNGRERDGASMDIFKPLIDGHYYKLRCSLENIEVLAMWTKRSGWVCPWWIRRNEDTAPYKCHNLAEGFSCKGAQIRRERYGAMGTEIVRPGTDLEPFS